MCIDINALKGVQRCYFIDVGSRIEQGPINVKTNKACERKYRTEINLGKYDKTIDPESEENPLKTKTWLHLYTKGDSKH